MTISSMFPHKSGLVIWQLEISLGYMKSITYSLVVLFIVGTFILSCEKEEGNQIKMDITGQLLSHSICKNLLKSTSLMVYTPDSLSCVQYSFDQQNNKLTLSHINAGFNCCPDSLFCKVDLMDDTIMIYEYEKSALCRCNCLYDLNIEINGVVSDKYHIKFIEPYTADQTKLIFDVDLSNNSTGSVCVTRKQYPWGVKSFNP